MKTLLFDIMVLVALAAGPAVAADMPVKAPFYKSPRPAVYGWTGCYVGGIGGYAWNSGKSSYQDPNIIQDPINGVPRLRNRLDTHTDQHQQQGVDRRR
jgi:opacity protein-like surface antigen